MKKQIISLTEYGFIVNLNSEKCLLFGKEDKRIYVYYDEKPEIRDTFRGETFPIMYLPQKDNE